MKKSILFLLVLGYTTVFSQTSQVKKAKDYYEEFQQTKKIESLEKSLKSIQEAMSDEKALKSEYTFFYHGAILKALYDNTAEGKKDLESTIPAINYLKKSLEINPKFDEKNQILLLLKFLGYDLYKNGIDYYNQKNNLKAYESYKNLMSLYDYLKQNNSNFKYPGTNKDSSDIALSDINNNFMVFAINAGKLDEAISILKNETKTSPSPTKFLQLAQLYGQTGDSMARAKTTQEAFALYPENIDILIGSINLDLDQKNYKNATPKLEKAISLDSKNPNLYQRLGAMYEDQKNIEKASETYQKGLKNIPNNYALTYSLGTMKYNLGVELYKSSDKSKSYLPLFQEAKSLFKSCQNIDPSKQEVDKLIDNMEKIK